MLHNHGKEEVNITKQPCGLNILATSSRKLSSLSRCSITPMAVTRSKRRSAKGNLAASARQSFLWPRILQKLRASSEMSRPQTAWPWAVSSSMSAPVPQPMSRIFSGRRPGLLRAMRFFAIRRTPINHQYVFSSSKFRLYSVKYTNDSPSKIDPLFNDIVGPGLHFIEDRSHIFSDHPQAEQLDSAENRAQHGQRGPAWRQIGLPKEVTERDVNFLKKAQQTKENK